MSEVIEVNEFYNKMQEVSNYLNADFEPVFERSCKLMFNESEGYHISKDWRGKCEVSCYWPNDEENKPMSENDWFYIPYGEKPKHRIGLNWNKSAEKIAQDINRRLSRPYKKAFKEALRRLAQKQYYKQKFDALKARFDALTEGLDYRCDVYHNSETVDLTLKQMTPDTAAEIIETYKAGTDDL